MSYTILRKNIENLIKENNYQIADLERRAGLKKNNIYYIVKGTIQKPSSEVLEAIAKVFGLTVEELFIPPPKRQIILTTEELDLITQITQTTIKVLKEQDSSISYEGVCSILSYIYNYSVDANSKEIDEKFVRWLIKQKLANNLN